MDDPVSFPTDYDAATHSFGLCRVTRDDLVRAPFLDGRFTEGRPPLERVSATAPTPNTTPSLGFVLHTAFCGSTLLTRCLDAPGVNLSLREPNVLMDLANAVRTRPAAEQSRVREALDAALGRLAQPYADAEAVLIKPTNAATAVYPLIASARAGARFVLLHSGLRSFLVSVIKKGEQGRHFVRTLYNIFGLDGTGVSRIPARQAMTFTDLQVAALVWRHQIEALDSLCEQAGGARTLVLDGEDFIRDPRRHLPRLRDFLGLAFSDDDLAAIAAGDLFQRNAKFDDERYDAGVREEEARGIEDAWAGTLDLICGWAAGLVLDRRVGSPLITAPA
jgi:hypothetical protein